MEDIYGIYFGYEREYMRDMEAEEPRGWLRKASPNFWGERGFRSFPAWKMNCQQVFRGLVGEDWFGGVPPVQVPHSRAFSEEETQSNWILTQNPVKVNLFSVWA